MSPPISSCLAGRKKKSLLSFYFTAGYPKIDSLPLILHAMEEGGADFVEVGIPFSDPLADGPVIQQSNQQALKAGLNLEIVFGQLRKIPSLSIPLVLMSYLNPLISYGMEKLSRQCESLGIRTLIIPDLPPWIYEKSYRPIFEKYGISPVFMISEKTSVERIEKILDLSGEESFVYAVSSSSTTGTKTWTLNKKYFSRLKTLNQRYPVMVGFNLSSPQDLKKLGQYVSGGIIGSALIRYLGTPGWEQGLSSFVQGFRQSSD
ncbi:MAG: tryptophan synthase subunit alpha [Cytophagales bacterium]|nr:tryptophan synthase subunit alpha [Cytophagales bacterium]